MSYHFSVFVSYHFTFILITMGPFILLFPNQVTLMFITSKYCEKVNLGRAGDNCELEFDHAGRSIIVH